MGESVIPAMPDLTQIKKAQLWFSTQEATMSTLFTFVMQTINSSLVDFVEWFDHLSHAKKVGLVTLTASVGYLSLVRFLRWRRYNALHRKYAGKMETMTPEEARQIMIMGYQYDMPGLLNYADSFALFKTYAIPSVSRLLAKTKQLSTKEHVSKRYADTEILISTFMSCPISGAEKSGNDAVDESRPVEEDARAAISIARINWLHSHYDISNDAYLYTLALFILEPITWTDRFGWRQLSPLERQAHYVFWVWVGEQMGMKDIPDSIEEFRLWSTAYELERMVPDPINREVASFTLEELLHAVPERFGLKSFFRRLAICLLEDRVRLAMMQPEQPKFLHSLVNAVFISTAFCHRYLSLPRWKECSLVVLDMPKETKDGSEVRMHPTRWQAKPWYKPQSKGVGAISDRIAIWMGLYDDMPGPQYRSNGYRLEEMGPLHFENAGHEAVMRMAGDIHGCPIKGRLARRD